MKIPEYLNKKAVLEWLKEQQKRQEEKRDRLGIGHPYWEYHEGAADYLSLAVEEFESGAFDADESEGTWKATSEFAFRLNDQLKAEIQHLRAALEFIEEEMVDDTSERAQRINKIISEALEGIKP